MGQFGDELKVDLPTPQFYYQPEVIVELAKRSNRKEFALSVCTLLVFATLVIGMAVSLGGLQVLRNQNSQIIVTPFPINNEYYAEDGYKTVYPCGVPVLTENFTDAIPCVYQTSSSVPAELNGTIGGYCPYGYYCTMDYDVDTKEYYYDGCHIGTWYQGPYCSPDCQKVYNALPPFKAFGLGDTARFLSFYYSPATTITFLLGGFAFFMVLFVLVILQFRGTIVYNCFVAFVFLLAGAFVLMTAGSALDERIQIGYGTTVGRSFNCFADENLPGEIREMDSLSSAFTGFYFSFALFFGCMVLGIVVLFVVYLIRFLRSRFDKSTTPALSPIPIE